MLEQKGAQLLARIRLKCVVMEKEDGGASPK